MAKDPAFLFYPGDWLGGTMGMTFEEKGAYLDLLMFQFNFGPFTEDRAKMVLRDNPKLWDVLCYKFQKNDSGLFFNKRLSEEKEKRQSYTESRRQSRLKSDEDNVRIYIVRDDVRGTYKIGSSVNPVRRYNELSNQKDPAIMHDDQGSRSITLVWYSDAYPRIEESKLHKHFSLKNITGEWFSLSDLDLHYIYSKYKGTMYRTSKRTEDEDENKNVIGIDELLKESFDEKSIEGIKMTFPKHDIQNELSIFKLKVRGSPGKYVHRDSGSIRQAFIYQLSNSRSGKSDKTAVRRADATIEQGREFGAL